jgi:hypothetical protein
MIGIKAILLLVMILGTFSSLFLVIVKDALYLISSPTANATKQLMVDTGNLVLNSQIVIKDAVMSMKSGSYEDDPSYASYLFQRIVAGSLLTIVMIYIVYLVLTKFPIFHAIAPIYAILLSIIIIGLAQVVSAAIITKEIIYPYQGFVSILENKEIFIDYLNKTLMA